MASIRDLLRLAVLCCEQGLWLEGLSGGVRFRKRSIAIYARGLMTVY